MFLADKKQTYGKLIGDCFRACKPLFKKILPVYITQAVVLYGLSYLILGDTVTEVTEVISTSGCGDALSSGDPTKIAGIIQEKMGNFAFAYLILIPLYIYFSINMFVRGDGALSGNQEKVAGSWLAGAKRFFPVIVYSLLIFAMFVAIGLIAVLLAFISAAIGKWAVVVSGAAIAIFSFVLIVRLFYGYALLVSRQRGIFAVMSNSFRLTKGYFWRIVGMYIIVLVLPAVGFGILAGISGVIVPAGTANTITITTISIVQNFVLTMLAIGATYVFLNDSLHCHGESDDSQKTVTTESIQQDSTDNQ